MIPAGASLKGDAWTCVEWAIVGVQSGAPRVSVLVDGEVRIDSAPVTGGYSTNSSVLIGERVSAGNFTPVEFWIDDLVVSSAPIGCTN